MHAARRSCAAYRREQCTDTPARSRVDASHPLSQHTHHRPQRVRLSCNTEPIPTGQHELDHRSRRPRRLHQREAYRPLFSQPPPPSVEGILTQAAVPAKSAHRLSTLLLLCDPCQPLLTPFRLSVVHASTTRGNSLRNPWW